MKISDLQNGELFTGGPSATVEIERQRDVGIVRVCGDLDAPACADLFATLTTLRRDNSVRVAVLIVDSSRSQVAHTWQALEEMENLTESKVTFSYVRNALGSAMLLALASRGVYAHPTAKLGYLSATLLGGDSSPVAAVLSTQCNYNLAARLMKLRPDVNANRLLFSTIIGEAAEMFDVVDFLHSSEAAWLGKLLERSKKREQV
jgi:hypothetical protein